MLQKPSHKCIKIYEQPVSAISTAVDGKVVKIKYIHAIDQTFPTMGGSVPQRTLAMSEDIVWLSHVGGEGVILLASGW